MDVNAYYHEVRSNGSGMRCPKGKSERLLTDTDSISIAQMFLRGIPELSLRMKRPPKVKNAASAARNAAGADMGTPDFYRIGKIAPLPPSIPFKPVIQESKGASGDNSGSTRLVILPLNSGEERPDELEDLSLSSGWGIAGAQSSGIAVTQGEFADPFQEEAQNPPGGGPALEGAEGTNQEASRTDPVAAGSMGEETPEMNTQEGAYEQQTATDSFNEQLSKADISYLAHQNRILLSHFGTMIQGQRHS